MSDCQNYPFNPRIDHGCGNGTASVGGGVGPLTPNRAIITDSTGALQVSTTTSLELSYLGGLTGNVQQQLEGKEPTLIKGNFEEITSAVLALSGNIGAVIGSGLNIEVLKATAAQDGYLSKEDWAAFNAKASNALPQGQIFIGDNLNQPVPQLVSGDFTISETGVGALADAVITNIKVATGAAIALNKLAALNPGIVPVTDLSGFLTNSNVTTTLLDYLLGLTGPIQTQLNRKLDVVLTNQAVGDILFYDGVSWVNLAKGNDGEAFFSTSGNPVWAPLPDPGQGDPGDSSYTYIAYADDGAGNGFTLTQDGTKDFVQFLTTNVEIIDPGPGNFTGVWKNYAGDGDQWRTTSNSSMEISLGVKTIIVEPGKAYSTGQFMVAAVPGDPSNRLDGVVQSYNSLTGQLTFEALQIVGSGIFSSWDVNIQAAGIPKTGQIVTKVITAGDTDSGSYVINEAATSAIGLSAPIDIDNPATEDLQVYVYLPSVVGSLASSAFSVIVKIDTLEVESQPILVGTTERSFPVTLVATRPLEITAGSYTLSVEVKAITGNITVDNASLANLDYFRYIDADAGGGSFTLSTDSTLDGDAATTALSVVGLKGTYATDAALKAFPTTGETPGLIRYRVEQGRLMPYLLEAGTSAEISPLILRPDDYAASTNEKVWRNLNPKHLKYTELVVAASLTLTETQVIASDILKVQTNTGAFTITAPATPVAYYPIRIQDIQGNAVTNNITFNGNGKLIRGSATVAIVSNYGEIELYYDPVDDVYQLSEISGGTLSSLLFTGTHAQNKAVLDAGNLIVGALYQTTDFQTIHQIPNTSVIHIEATEALTQQAVANNRFNTEAYSEANPNDEIQYDFNDVLAEDGTTDRKGKITFRKDKVNDISTWYDFRGVVFRRFKTSLQHDTVAGAGASWTVTAIYGNVPSVDPAGTRNYYEYMLDMSAAVAHDPSPSLAVSKGGNTLTRELVKSDGSSLIANEIDSILSQPEKWAWVYYDADYDKFVLRENIWAQNFKDKYLSHVSSNLTIGKTMVLEVTSGDFEDYYTFENSKAPASTNGVKIGYSEAYNNVVFKQSTKWTELGPNVKDMIIEGIVIDAKFDGDSANNIIAGPGQLNWSKSIPFEFFNNLICVGTSGSHQINISGARGTNNWMQGNSIFVNNTLNNWTCTRFKDNVLRILESEVDGIGVFENHFNQQVENSYLYMGGAFRNNTFNTKLVGVAWSEQTFFNDVVFQKPGLTGYIKENRTSQIWEGGAGEPIIFEDKILSSDEDWSCVDGVITIPGQVPQTINIGGTGRITVTGNGTNKFRLTGSGWSFLNLIEWGPSAPMIDTITPPTGKTAVYFGRWPKMDVAAKGTESSSGTIPPATPTGLETTESTQSSLTTGWNTVAGVDGYNIYVNGTLNN